LLSSQNEFLEGPVAPIDVEPKPTELLFDLGDSNSTARVLAGRFGGRMIRVVRLRSIEEIPDKRCPTGPDLGENILLTDFNV
jgi:hypothetical protein